VYYILFNRYVEDQLKLKVKQHESKKLISSKDSKNDKDNDVDIDDLMGNREELNIHSLLYNDGITKEENDNENASLVSRYISLDEGMTSEAKIMNTFICFFLNVLDFVNSVYQKQDPNLFRPFTVPAYLFGNTQV
jgi:hypothetical protein